MKYSQSFIQTLREVPSEAETISHQLMLRAGLIRKVAAGIYDWLPLGLRVLRNVEKIIREEMNAISGLEVWLPHLQPRDLWEETGRWPVYGKELMRLKDRKNADFCLGPTAEEVITDLVRREVRSYKALPLMLYQFGTKFRDEIRPRFGVMRAREFYMKDAYSFHLDETDATRFYQIAFDAYKKIFERCGLQFRPVEAHSGAIGGSYSHEFMVIAETGEEGIVSCDCGYGANVEQAPTQEIKASAASTFEAPKLVETPKVTSVADVAQFLKQPVEQIIKALVYEVDGEKWMVLVRGDHELNEIKLQKHFKATYVKMVSEETYVEVTGSPVGFAGPVGSKARILSDYAIRSVTDGIAGGNQKDFHQMHVVPERDFKSVAYADLRKAIAGDLCPKCQKPLHFSRGIEVGHTFKLGTKYSASMKAEYLDPQGKSQTMVMGCYGIGVSRVVAACIEQSHDAGGIVWPTPLAPWKVIVSPLNTSNPVILETAENIYKELQAKGVDVLLDDRDERAGVKLKDADLIGIPWRIAIGEKKIGSGLVEIKKRSEQASQDIAISDAVPFVLKALNL